MHLILGIFHSEQELEASIGILMMHSISRVMVFEGTGIGRDTTLNLRVEPSFSLKIWRHLQSKRQAAWVAISVIDEISTFDLVKEKIEQITGSLDAPRSGILSVIAVEFAESLLPPC